jgi:hypothetical protein
MFGSRKNQTQDLPREFILLIFILKFALSAKLEDMLAWKQFLMIQLLLKSFIMIKFIREDA